jgi:hypothetical protein
MRRLPLIFSLVLLVLFLGDLSRTLQAGDDQSVVRATVEKDDRGKQCIHVRWRWERDDVSSYEVEEKRIDGSGHKAMRVAGMLREALRPLAGESFTARAGI